MWKDFFYYSKAERRAVMVLITLIIVTFTLYLACPYLGLRPSENVLSATDSINFLAYSDSAGRAMKYVRSDNGDKRVNLHLKAFDPNTIDSAGLLGMGVPQRVIRNLLKYRRAGGRFKMPGDVAKIYGLTDEMFSEMEPYILINNRNGNLNMRNQKEWQHVPLDTALYSSRSSKACSEEPFLKTKSFPSKFSEGTIVDLNLSDTATLKKVPGIGSGIAALIVNYRNRLGGFCHVNQLKEVEYVTPEMLHWFKVENTNIQKINVNKAGLDRLRLHPYMNFYKAKVIIEHRKKRGSIHNLQELSLYEEFTEDDLKRLAPYLEF